jgi:PIN domain nuclease of toxin-antitoxin system
MLNLDTHMIVYLLAGKLTDAELRYLRKGEIAISDIVLWELCKLIELKRLQLDLESSAFRSLLRNLSVIPISLEIAKTSTKLDFKGDPADEIIAATSIVEDFPLLTRDARIRRSRLVPLAG